MGMKIDWNKCHLRFWFCKNEYMTLHYHIVRWQVPSIQKGIAIIHNHFQLDLAKQVDYCKTFVKNLVEIKKGLSWDARAEQFENSLAGECESLLEALIITKNSFSGLCSFCNVRNVDIVCDDCGRNSKLCSDCDEGVLTVQCTINMA